MTRIITIASKNKNLIGLVLAVLLFFASAAVVWRHPLSRFEINAFDFFYDWPLSLRPLMLAITQFGSAGVCLLLAGAVFVFRQRRLAGRLLTSGGLAYILVLIAKQLVRRPRAFVLINGVVSREIHVSGLGFPSGHTAMAAAVSVTLRAYLPRRWRWLVPVWITAVGISRLYLGVHLPLDITGGFGLGLASALAVRLCTNRLEKSPGQA